MWYINGMSDYSAVCSGIRFKMVQSSEAAAQSLIVDRRFACRGTTISEPQITDWSSPKETTNYAVLSAVFGHWTTLKMALAVHSTWLEIKLVLESVKVCGGWCATIWTLVVGVALFHAPHYIQFFNSSLSCSSLKWPQHGGPTPTRTTCT